MKNEEIIKAVLAPEGLRAVFQPIYLVTDAGRWVHAVECLIRGPKGTNFELPAMLFEWVQACGHEVEADRVCTTVCLQSAAELPRSVALTVNVHGATLSNDRSYADFLTGVCADAGIAIERITLEVVENSPAQDRQQFARTISALRKLGARLAIDDVGIAHSNLKNILDTRPDYLKLDGYITRDCHRDYYRRLVIESMAHLGRKFGALVVAEGIEDERDLHALTNLGIELIQGFLLARPVPVAELLGILTQDPPQGPIPRWNVLSSHFRKAGSTNLVPALQVAGLEGAR